jgi:iron complex transport system permease protein
VKARAWIALLCCACLVALLVSASIGPTGLRLPGWHADPILLELRAPRVVLGAIVGAALALAGVALQALLRNDLAEPYVLGLSGGSAAGAVISLALFPGLMPGPAAALGALCAAALVRALARGADATRLLLAGVAVSSLLSSATGLVLVLAPRSQLLRSGTYWLFGGIGTPEWTALLVPAAVLTGALVWLIRRAEGLDRLTLGGDVAASLGTDVRVMERGILLGSVALTAASVAASGLIGFVGLIAPHAARRWLGPGHRALLPVAALIGALLCVLADAVARTAFAPREVPVGLLTAALGGPLFLWQLQRGAGASARAGEREHAGGQSGEASVAIRGAASRSVTVPLEARAVDRVVVHASQLAVGRGARAVLRGVELRLQAGERVALLGANGSGKTSLLRALAGLDAPLSGTLSWSRASRAGAGAVGGADWGADSGQGALPVGAERVRVLGVLLQSEAPTTFTVRQLVTLGLGLPGPADPQARRQVEETLRWAELCELGERPCTTLSGGEAQRAALARALVGGPRLLLLDEPTLHLDMARQAGLVRTLDRLRGEVAVVMATHELGLAASCDRVVLLHQGAVAAAGTPREVLTPALLARCLGVLVERSDEPGGDLRLTVVAQSGHPREVAA